MATNRFQEARIIVIVLALIGFWFTIYCLANLNKFANLLKASGHFPSSEISTVITTINWNLILELIIKVIGLGGAFLNNRCLALTYFIIVSVVFVTSFIFILFGHGNLALIIMAIYY